MNPPWVPMRGRARSGIEEIVDEAPQSAATTASVPVDPRGQEGPQSRPRNPPVTVRPRIPVEMRRPRMPSTHPMGMAANANTWDQSRRMRTVSGM